jgi:DNA polymerase-4
MVVIACSKEAKAAGCKNVMRVPDAMRICPGLILVTQRCDLFRRAHNTLLNEITCAIPIEGVKSIDELVCKPDKSAIRDLHGTKTTIQEKRKTPNGFELFSQGRWANFCVDSTHDL